MMLDSIDNGPLVCPTVEENEQTKPKKYSELTEAQQLQDDCDVQETNIILHERECRLYNLSDKFAHVSGDTLYEYYWRFSQLINDMHTIGMTMQQVQVNTKFLNSLPSKWSKFVTDVKLAKSLYTTNYDQLYVYLSQHERHANEVRISHERYRDSLAFVANSPTLYNPSQSPQHSDSGLAVPMFQQGEDPIECINKVIAFLSVVASRFPPSNNQLRTSFNPRNQATIQDGRVTGNVATAPPRIMKCYNCQVEGHMARQCQILDEEQLAFLADLVYQKLYGIRWQNLSSCDPEVLSEVPYSDSYMNDMTNQDVQEMGYSEQTHVDDFEDNEIHSGSNIILYSQYLQESQDAVIQDTNPSAPNDLLVLSLVEQMTNHVAHLDKENQTNKMVNESLTAELERYKERITIFKQRLNVDLNKRENLIDSQMDDLFRDRNVKLAAFQREINSLKETLSNNVKENESLSKTLTVFKT
ncbi:putative reverse transcriptase domain-containing protein [Tanacetum coccineum]|uniref:Reverse transcriptase domain-containing protein n=1 Tax=Tanacetum coccineum TaxID=301880 RepID=A0ABQ4WYD7_9ASTR